jgi:hypothetical protein
VRRSTSPWIRPIPTKTAIPTLNKRIAAMPTSWMIRCPSTYERLPINTAKAITNTAKNTSV